MKRFGYVAVALLLSNSFVSDVLAQNGHSFIDVQKSPLNYRHNGSGSTEDAANFSCRAP